MGTVALVVIFLMGGAVFILGVPVGSALLLWWLGLHWIACAVIGIGVMAAMIWLACLAGESLSPQW